MKIFNRFSMNNYEVYIFDQDGTIYPKSSPLGKELTEKTKKWLQEQSSIPFDDLRHKHPNFTDALQYLGLTLDQWHQCVCDPLAEEIDSLVSEDKTLVDLFESLPGQMHLVTLSSFLFTQKLLKALGLKSYFKTVSNLNDRNKGPTYSKIQRETQANPNEIAVFGDNLDIDLKPAQHIGLKTFLVDPVRPITEQFHSLVKSASLIL